MILSDTRIRELCLHQDMVRPFNPDLVQPASIDVRLGGEYVLGGYGEKHELPYSLKPFEGVVLATTAEYFKIPTDIAGKFEGKSSLGRRGLMTHITAGFIDPGFEGELTLELLNVGVKAFRLVPGMRIGQIAFQTVSGEVKNPYNSTRNHYQKQSGPTPYWKDASLRDREQEKTTPDMLEGIQWPIYRGVKTDNDIPKPKEK